MANMAITEQTPNTIPSMVSRERRRWSQRALTPRRTVRRNQSTLAKNCSRLGREMGGLVEDIALHYSVPHADNPLGTLGDFVAVGHHDDRFPGMVKVVEDLENVATGS